ncbi:hypothetical protein B0H19DRAFT_1271221 [Mycena capillaripes]|nr:hypothetical protein B0H19DRAFT_1271221 [Mycena capillaripes]
MSNLSSWLHFLLLASTRHYALNPPTQPYATRLFVHVWRCHPRCLRHDSSSHGNDVHLSLHVVGMPLSIYELRPILLHAAAPLLPRLRPSSLTPPPFSPMLTPVALCSDADIHTSHKFVFLAVSLYPWA